MAASESDEVEGADASRGRTIDVGRRAVEVDARNVEPRGALVLEGHSRRR